MSDSKLTIVIPQWQGGGQDLCTYYGAFAFHENYLHGAADVTVEVSEGDIGPVKDGYGVPIDAHDCKVYIAKMVDA